MHRTFHIEVITPACVVYENEIIALSVPTRDGRLGIMAGHEPMVATLKEGTVIIRPGHNEPSLELPVKGGYLEVEHDKVVIMIDIDNEDDDLESDFEQRFRTEAAPASDQPEAKVPLMRRIRRLVNQVGLLTPKHI